MSVYGIVSEFNPFHCGHKYLIDKAREMGASSVICVMSGNATQRGELALCDKYYRAEAAVRCGVNLVLELPYPFSSASAEFFARGAISVLYGLCDTVIFGSECGDIDLLTRCAELTAKDEFKKEYSLLLSEGNQSASAYISLIEKKLGAVLSSNDILGVEYIKAAKRLGVGLNFVTVKREGSAYLCDKINKGNDEFASAMAIRKAVLAGRLEDALHLLPTESAKVLEHAYADGAIIDYNKYSESARFYFRLKKPSDFSGIAEMSCGIAERISREANESVSGVDFFERISTKRYTDAKLHRAILFAMTEVFEDDLSLNPQYTFVLGADTVGRKLLSEWRRIDLPTRIVTKPADVSELTDNYSIRQSKMNEALDAIYTFCLSKSISSGDIIRKKSYIT